MNLPSQDLSPADAAAFLLGAPTALTALTPEVSPRRYFRPQNSAPAADVAASTSEPSWLVVLSSAPAPEATTDFLRNLGIRVPRIGASIEGAYLVEDLGDQHLVHAPTLANYEDLVISWMSFAQAELPQGHPNRRFKLDQGLFNKELSMFLESYLLGFRGLHFSASELAIVQENLQQLAELASAGPQCLQHRDFHARNILLPNAGPTAWIDHQDLRSGPLYYDLASLYTDAYVQLPDDVFELLRAQVMPLGEQTGLHPEDALEQFLLTALQRVLKALGTFGKVLLAGRQDFVAAESQARMFANALLDQLGVFPELRRILG
jgi:aminoglycoside/choline kinase family phosphotransferase